MNLLPFHRGNNQKLPFNISLSSTKSIHVNLALDKGVFTAQKSLPQRSFLVGSKSRTFLPQDVLQKDFIIFFKDLVYTAWATPTLKIG